MKSFYLCFVLVVSMSAIECSNSIQEIILVKDFRQCSRSHSQQKFYKNQQEYLQQMAMCRQGDRKACEQAREDQASMNKHANLMRTCPYP